MIKAINNVSSTSFKGSEVKKEEKAQKTPEEIKDGKKKLAIGLAAAATVAIACVAIASKVKSGKPVNLSDIKFDKGIAKKGDKLFTGTVSDTLTGGDKITMTYKNGKIMQSVREGSKNVTKKFEYGCYNPYNSGVGTKITTLNSEGKVIGETKLGFFKDGKLNFKRFPDGTAKGWRKNGQLEYEIFSDKTEKWWYENGQLSHETFPNGTRKAWHENGQLSCETFSDKTAKGWYENGQLEYETFSNGTKKAWHKNGQLSYETFPNGTAKAWYENGQLSCETFPDGTKKEWHKNGQLKY